MVEGVVLRTEDDSIVTWLSAAEVRYQGTADASQSRPMGLWPGGLAGAIGCDRTSDMMVSQSRNWGSGGLDEEERAGQGRECFVVLQQQVLIVSGGGWRC